MTVLEKRKFRLIRAIMDDSDENRVSEVEHLYKKQSIAEPCVYTVDEMNESLRQLEKDFEVGNITGYTSEQLKKHAM